MNKAVIVIILLCVLKSNAYCQDSIKNTYKKNHKSFLLNNDNWNVELPVWIPGFFGDFTYGDVNIEGESGPTPEHPIEPGWKPGNILDRLFKSDGKLNFFFLTSLSYNNYKFLGKSDLFYGSIDGSVLFTLNNKELVQAKFATVFNRTVLGYNLIEKHSVSEKLKYNLYAYGGIRIHKVRVSSDLNQIVNKLDVNPRWTEPLVGLRNEIALNKWFFTLQADVGSFNIDQKVSYMINLYAYYKVRKWLSIRLGWNDWDIYYKDSFRGENLVLNIHLSGPCIAASFHF